MTYNPLILLALSASCLSVSACNRDTVNSTEAHGPDSITVELITNDRSSLGTATLRQGPNGVLIRIDAAGLPAGWHGMHLHGVADCSADDFTSTAGHINPEARAHGLMNSEGPDNADLPNIYAHDDGTVRVELFTDRVSFNGHNGTPALLDDDGSAIIIHLNEDDHETQPIGGAGPRIGCGVISSE